MTESPYYCATCGYVELDAHLRCAQCGSDQVMVRDVVMVGGVGVGTWRSKEAIPGRR